MIDLTIVVQVVVDPVDMVQVAALLAATIRDLAAAVLFIAKASKIFRQTRTTDISTNQRCRVKLQNTLMKNKF